MKSSVCVWIAVASLALLGGCVTKGKYDDLKRQYDDARLHVGEQQQKIGSLEQALADEQRKLAELEQQHQALEQQRAALAQQGADKDAEIERLRAQGAQLSDQLAKVVKDRSALKQATDQLTRALTELAQRRAEAERRVAEYRNLLARFKTLIDAGKLEVKMTDGRMVLVLPTDVLFDTGSARLSKPGKEALVEVAQVLKDMHERRFQIEGHTDNVPIHNARYASNWELASARALGVVRAMTEAGMDGRLLSAASYGEFHPTASNDDDAGRAKNRRIEIVLVPDLSLLPGFEELNRAVQQH